MNCTGKRCLMQYGKVDPETCQCVSYCPQATPPKTNADRIRSMSDKELSVFLYGLVNEFGCMNHDCLDFNYCKVHSGEHRYDGWLDWLKQEVDE